MAVQPVRGVVTVAAALARQRVGVDTPWDRCAAQTGEPRGGLVCAAGGAFTSEPGKRDGCVPLGLVGNVRIGAPGGSDFFQSDLKTLSSAL